MVNYIRFANRSLEKVIFWLTAFSTSIFTLFVILSVVTRYLTKTPILSSIEISRLFFVWACFLAATLAYRRNVHIAISFIMDKLPTKLSRAIDILINSLIVVFFGFIFTESIDIVKLLWHTHLPLSGLSQAWLYLPVPFIAIVIILFTIEKSIDALTKN